MSQQIYPKGQTDPDNLRLDNWCYPVMRETLNVVPLIKIEGQEQEVDIMGLT